MAEAWAGTFKAELVAGRRFPSFEQAEHETLRWIGFYNAERLHQELGDVPPAEFELTFQRAGDGNALSGDLRPALAAAHVLIPLNPRPSGPAEAVRPALVGGAPAGLGEKQQAT
jgi:putative transposase